MTTRNRPWRSGARRRDSAPPRWRRDAQSGRRTGRASSVAPAARPLTGLWHSIGPAGKAASKLSLGSRCSPGTAKPKTLSRPTRAEDEARTDDELAAIPIQQSIEIAVPPEIAYRLALGFEDYPLFMKHVRDVVADGDAVEFEARLRGSGETIAIEVFDVRENERIDWRGDGRPGARRDGQLPSSGASVDPR